MESVGRSKGRRKNPLHWNQQTDAGYYEKISAGYAHPSGGKSGGVESPVPAERTAGFHEGMWDKLS